MNKVNMNQYYDAIKRFFAKHEIEACHTSAMQDNHYVKHYVCKDGAQLWEDNMVITETIEAELHGVKVKADVKMWKSECFSTEWASMYLFQQTM